MCLASAMNVYNARTYSVMGLRILEYIAKANAVFE